MTEKLRDDIPAAHTVSECLASSADAFRQWRENTSATPVACLRSRLATYRSCLRGPLRRQKVITSAIPPGFHTALESIYLGAVALYQGAYLFDKRIANASGECLWDGTERFKSFLFVEGRREMTGAFNKTSYLSVSTIGYDEDVTMFAYGELNRKRRVFILWYFVSASNIHLTPSLRDRGWVRWLSSFSLGTKLLTRLGVSKDRLEWEPLEARVIEAARAEQSDLSVIFPLVQALLERGDVDYLAFETERPKALERSLDEAGEVAKTVLHRLRDGFRVSRNQSIPEASDDIPLHGAARLQMWSKFVRRADEIFGNECRGRRFPIGILDLDYRTPYYEGETVESSEAALGVLALSEAGAGALSGPLRGKNGDALVSKAETHRILMGVYEAYYEFLRDLAIHDGENLDGEWTGKAEHDALKSWIEMHVSELLSDSPDVALRSIESVREEWLSAREASRLANQ